MAELICPVCGGRLTRGAAVWRCEKGHSFDVARQGYVNLLPVTQKHSRQPGDPKTQVDARRAFLSRGLYAPIAEKLTALCRAGEPRALLDVGCGEGYYLAAAQRTVTGLECWGVDVSKEAVRRAAARYKNITFLTATAAHLPFADGQFDLLSSLFALTLPEEFFRVLRPGGRLIQAVAGEDHLLGLRGLIYREVRRKPLGEDPVLPGFMLERREMLEFPLVLKSGEAVMELLAMTPHYLRITKEGLERARAAERLEDRAQVCFRVYRREA